MSEITAPVSQGSPLWLAWEAYAATEEYANTKRWAVVPEHAEGSLWAAFERGFAARQSPAPIAGKAEMPDQGCKLPPDGWYCSLEPGHDGPCAALPNRTAMLGQEWVSKVTSSDAPELSVIGAAVDNGMPPHVARAVRTAREYRMAADHSRTPHTNNAIYEVTRWFADDRERLLARVEDLERRYKMLRQDYSDLRRVDAGR